jgi:hypothetical protein
MAFFNELIETIERTPQPAERPPALGATATVQMYAPRRLRSDRPEAQQKAEAERAYWRDRAFRAESQLQALEARIQGIAAFVSPSR